MPETAVNEDCGFVFRQDDVGPNEEKGPRGFRMTADYRFQTGRSPEFRLPIAGCGLRIGSR
jgi:hypothetical protein